MNTVAVLCAAQRSIYHEIDGLDVYTVDRDARSFPGGSPVVCHPPCRAWSAMVAHQAKPAEGEKELAPFCVEVLRENGGVLEHPAYSRLWDALGLPMPGCSAGELWCERVNQSWWGDGRPKKTWLLFSGVTRSQVEFPFRLLNRGDKRWDNLSKRKRAATPESMARWLVDVARMAA